MHWDRNFSLRKRRQKENDNGNDNNIIYIYKIIDTRASPKVKIKHHTRHYEENQFCPSWNQDIDVYMQLPVLLFVPTATCPGNQHHWKYPDCLHCTLLFNIYRYQWDPYQTFFFLSSIFLSFLIGGILCGVLSSMFTSLLCWEAWNWTQY